MGFRTGAYAKIWEVTPMSDTSTKVRLSVSRKNKQTNEYEQDFSGFVLAIGTAAAKKAACLKEGERIKLGDVDVTTKYDKEKKVTYTNFKMFSFEVEGDESSSQTTDPQPTVDDGEIDDSRLPFYTTCIVTFQTVLQSVCVRSSERWQVEPATAVSIQKQSKTSKRK